MRDTYRHAQFPAGFRGVAIADVELVNLDADIAAPVRRPARDASDSLCTDVRDPGERPEATGDHLSLRTGTWEDPSMSSAHPESLPAAEQAWLDDVDVPTDLEYASADEVDQLLPEVLAELSHVFDEAGI
ncbi:hypothetical protein OG216_44520 [Streptomycetaceae bacterium NBC_01309]